VRGMTGNEDDAIEAISSAIIGTGGYPWDVI
jgi:hypothetical protein